MTRAIVAITAVTVCLIGPYPGQSRSISPAYQKPPTHEQIHYFYVQALLTLPHFAYRMSRPHNSSTTA